MDSELWLPGKWSLRSREQQIILANRGTEPPEQLVMKALLWALYLPDYPALGVDLFVDHRYRPGVAAVDGSDDPQFWGEVDEMSGDYLRKVLKRYRHTHFAFARWEADETPLLARVERACRKLSRSAPIDLVIFPVDSYTRFISPTGEITISHADLQWLRLD